MCSSDLGRHMLGLVADAPQPGWDPWLAPIEWRLLAWIGADGGDAGSAWGYLRPLLISNLAFALPASLLLAWQPPWLNPGGFQAFAGTWPCTPASPFSPAPISST